MKTSKKTRKSNTGQNKNTNNTWKIKAISRGKENAKLRKRIKELTTSRDTWKQKHKELNKGVKKTNLNSGESAIKHHYSLALVALVLQLYSYGNMSLRSCRHSLICMYSSLGFSGKIPSHSSIRNWLCKCGYYRVKTSRSEQGEYVVYVDESITFGSEKLLLVLGVPLKKVTYDRALVHKDMSVLYVGASQEWKGLDIEKKLKEIAKNKQIKYVVSDEGSNLKKAYKSLGYNHIEDCTHVLANHLKRIYEKDTEFIAFRKLIGLLRRNWNLSKEKSQYMPPTMRGKMRFANIFPCVNWAKRILKDWNKLSAEVQDSLLFLQEKQDFIQSLIEIEIIFKMVCTQLKNEGFGADQKQAILDYLAKMKAGEQATIFIGNCKNYLDNLTVKQGILKQKNLLCSSDIIESYFGKFKAKVNPNNRSGLTEFIFTIATFGQPFSLKETKKALESIQCKHLILHKNQVKVA